MILNLPKLASRGLNSDVDPWDLPPEFITHGANFRIDAGSVQSYGGHSVIATAPTLFDPGYMILARTKVSPFLVMPGSDKIYSYIGGTYIDISGGISVSSDDVFKWSGCLNGSIVVLNNIELYPIYWAGSGDFITLPWSIDDDTTWQDKGYSCEVMRQHKNYLIALNLREDIDKPDSFRWSHPADENGIPFTWDEFASNGTAGIQALGGDGGHIVDGLSLRDSFIIYSQNAINVLDLSGDEFIWRRRELSATVGLLSKDCVVEVKGVHYFLSLGDILTNDGNTVRSIAHNIIQDRLATNINTEFVSRSFAFRNDKRKEVWFCVPEGTSETVNIAYIYQWRDQTWSVRDLPSGTSFLIVAPESSPVETYELDDSITYDDRTDKYSDGVAEVSFDNFAYATNNTSSELHLLENKIPVDDLDTVLERTDMALPDQIAVTTLTRLYPHIKGANPVRIQVGSQDRAGGSVRWKPYQVFDPKTQRKVDIRTTGALHAWRILSEGKGEFTFSGMDVEYQIDGIR